MSIEKFELFSGKFNHGKFHGLYGQGTSERKEDGCITEENIAGVLDSYSEPNSPKQPQLIKGGKSLGEINVRIIEKSLRGCNPLTEPLPCILADANRNVWLEKKIAYSIPWKMGRLAGASAAVVKPSKKITATITAGDCFLLVSFKNGRFCLSKNQVKKHDEIMHAQIAKIKYRIAREWKINSKKATQSQKKEINDEMWNRFQPFLERARIEAMNNPKSSSGYASLNGDPNSVKMWKVNNFNTEDIHKIIIFSDGLLPWNLLKNMEIKDMGKYILEMEARLGLIGIAQSTRSYEATNDFENYISQHEITAIVMEF